MKLPSPLTPAALLRALALAPVIVLCGCGYEPPQFRPNLAAVRKLDPESFDERYPYGPPGAGSYDQQERDLTTALTALFGTPDEPAVPAVEGAEVLDINKLRAAAGKVSSDQNGVAQGLYREHCVHCHGVTGDGDGPTAQFLNPYPRDFRRGLFKFKSTPIGQKPTHEDLKRTLMEGIPGTAMPSFRLLPEPEIEALIQYVKYLAIRGEVERQLIFEVSELDYANEEAPERLIDVALKEKDPEAFADQMELLKDLASGVCDTWANADSHVMAIPERPQFDDMAASVRKGREIFYGEIANCIKCHGDLALGDGQTTDYDEWTKDYLPASLADPQLVKETIAAYKPLGVHEPRNILPRNLRQGIYRGGRRPIDLYRRIRLGIEGTPMPAVLMKPEGAPAGSKGLTEEDIWHLIDYVRHLPYESISQPREHEPNYQRDRL